MLTSYSGLECFVAFCFSVACWFRCKRLVFGGRQHWKGGRRSRTKYLSQRPDWRPAMAHHKRRAINHMTKSKAKIRWLDEPEARNYPAALSYLSLIYPPRTARRIVSELTAARGSEFKAKDIFRASGLSLLGVSNSHVERDRKKIMAGERISPILLTRDPRHGKSYHCRWVSSPLCHLLLR